MISSRLLRQFIAVAQELHYGRAALRLHMAQPPLSQAIKQLEEIVGVTLLERSKHSVKLTAAGAVFLDHALNLVAQEQRAIDDARLAAKGLIGRLVLGFVGSVSYELMPKLLQQFRARFPAIQIDLRELTSKEQLDALMAGKIDAGILRLPLSNAADIQMRVIRHERFIAVLPKNHRLARAPQVDLAELRDESFMIFPADKIPSLHSKFVFACEEAGFSPRTVLEAWQMPSMVSLVASGFGIALLPSQVRSLVHRGVVYKEIRTKSAHLELQIALGWRRESSSAGVQSLLTIFEASP